jgi:hypothetical protein
VTDRQTNTKASLTDTAGAEQYIPREATERVLARLEAALDAGDRFIVLSGPPGLGKTLLLHVFEERQRAAREVIFSPFFHFPPDEARVWLRGLMRDRGMATVEESDPPALPRRVVSERPLLLILDEAQSMPVETAADLIEMLPDLAPGASILLAGIEGPRLDDVVENIGLPVEHVRLESPFSSTETRELLGRAMPKEAAGAISSPCGSEFEAETYHAAAEGNPRLLKTLMFRAERGEPPELPVDSSEAEAALDEASEVSSEDDRPREVSESGSDPSARWAPSVPERLEQDDRAARNAPKSESRRTRRLELFLVGMALGVGFLVSRSFVLEIAPPAWRVTPDIRSVLLPAVSAPPPERIAPAIAEPLTSPPTVATPSLDPGPVDEVPTAVADSEKVASAVVAGSVEEPSVVTPGPVEDAPLVAVAVAEEARGVGPDPVVEPPASVAARPPVTLHVNARPWATIRLDGETIGMTPLSLPGTRPGRYELEAELPDGRVVKRVVEIGPDSRFVSFP